jgi:Effector-associated domain 7
VPISALVRVIACLLLPNQAQRGSVLTAAPTPDAQDHRTSWAQPQQSMSRYSQGYPRPAIRRFIEKYFSSGDLLAICFDYFETVYREFTDDMRLSLRIQILLEHCVNHGEFDLLFDRLEEARPELFKKDLPEFTIEARKEKFSSNIPTILVVDRSSEWIVELQNRFAELNWNTISASSLAEVSLKLVSENICKVER